MRVQSGSEAHRIRSLHVQDLSTPRFSSRHDGHDQNESGGSEASEEATAAPKPSTPPASPEREVTSDVLEEVRKEAFEKGREYALSRQDAATDEVLTQIKDRVVELSAGLEEVKSVAADDAARLARSLLRAVLPAIADRGAGAQLETLIVEAIENSVPESAIAVTMHPHAYKALGQRLRTTFPGREIQFATDSKLETRQVVVDWTGGGSEIDLSRIIDSATKILEGTVPSDAPSIQSRVSVSPEAEKINASSSAVTSGE